MVEAAPIAVAYDEVWRPGKRKETRRGGQEHAKEAAPRQGRNSGRPPRKGQPAGESKRERATAQEHSPFAALKELRQSLVARRPQGG